jgi:dTDP-4-dehydrorhamnose 3,5-epimerase
MNVQMTALPEVKLLTPEKFGDARGFFSETWRADAFAKAGIAAAFIQDNQSYSAAPFTFRGLHYQKPPHAQAKLVRVLRGAALDIVVDIRKGSPTYRRHIAVELSAEKWNQIFIPEGFAHGALTLAPDTELFYKVTAHYAPEAERGIVWNDPALNIQLPVAVDKVILSDKDKNQPLLKDADNPFVYGR